MPATLLQKLLNAGHLPLDADDTQFQKLDEATQKLKDILSARPADVIPAVLLGLDADASGDEPLFDAAEGALQTTWATVRRRFTDRPRTLLRAMLLDACHRMGQHDARVAAIAWFTAHDYRPSGGLCPEYSVLRPAWMELGERIERRAMQTVARQSPPVVELPKFQMTIAARPRHVSDTNVYHATVPQLEALQGGTRQNPQLIVPWCTSTLLPWAASLSASVAMALMTVENRSIGASADYVEATVKAQHASLGAYSEALHQSIQALIAAWAKQREPENPCLNTLWWSQALYSPRLSRSYRELEPVAAAAAMAMDLATLVQAPAAASVAYLLGETVARLPRAGFEEQYTFSEILDALRGTGQDLRPHTPDTPRRIGRVPALVILEDAIHGREADGLRGRTGLDPAMTITLPAFAMAMFRALQARALAEAR